VQLMLLLANHENLFSESALSREQQKCFIKNTKTSLKVASVTFAFGFVVRLCLLSVNSQRGFVLINLQRRYWLLLNGN
jgi:hypothetical protein